MINFTPYPGIPYDRAQDYLGPIPSFLSKDNPKSAKEQIHDNYRHGGGWNTFDDNVRRKYQVLQEGERLKYPGDPPFRAIAWAKLRNEKIIVYEHAWVMIQDDDGTYEIARID